MRRVPGIVRLLLSAVGLLAAPAVHAVQRFPPPQFETSHTLPDILEPAARAVRWEYVDVAVLLIGLALAAWLALRARSRRGLVLLGIFSMLYFGFWRIGCVCAIGSIQNVAQASADPGYALPLTVLAFAALPLFFALLFGRVFCAGVCPHGALQDLVLIKPIEIPSWLEQGLKLLAYTYLGLAVWFAATGGGYIICEYDPFIPIFRLSGSTGMVLFGFALLAVGMFVGRPYCRFLCPYGVLLGLFSSVSRWRVTITPDTCVRCRLCEHSCPFGAIHPATDDAAARRAPVTARRLGVFFALLPVLVLVGVLLGNLSGNALARRSHVVALAERVQQEEAGRVEGTTDASAAFRASGETIPALSARAQATVARFTFGGMLAGGWVGLVVGVKLLVLAVRRRRPDYEADRAACVACARCYTHCPQEHLRRGGLPAAAATAGPGA